MVLGVPDLTFVSPARFKMGDRSSLLLEVFSGSVSGIPSTSVVATVVSPTGARLLLEPERGLGQTMQCAGDLVFGGHNYTGLASALENSRSCRQSISSLKLTHSAPLGIENEAGEKLGSFVHTCPSDSVSIGHPEPPKPNPT